jgi:hypothetical protein
MAMWRVWILGRSVEGIPNLWGERYDFSELPRWRKILALCAGGAAIALMIFIGPILPMKENGVYHSAPSAPAPARGQVYPVRVEGGYLRYVTREQAENLDFLKRTTGPSIGAFLVTAALVLLTYRSGRKMRQKP